MTTKKWRAIAVAAATICTFMIAPAAHASTTDLPDAPTHCAVEVSAVGPDAPQPDPVCFATPAEVERQFGLRVQRMLGHAVLGNRLPGAVA